MLLPARHTFIELLVNYEQNNLPAGCRITLLPIRQKILATERQNYYKETIKTLHDLF